MRTYGWATEREVLYRLPMVRGWAYYAFAIESDGWLSFSGMRRDSPGFIAKEITRLLDIQKKYDLAHGTQNPS
jgi:hypothetical protein